MKQKKNFILKLIIPILLIMPILLLMIVNKNLEINLLAKIGSIIPQAAISADDVVKIRKCWIY